MEAGCQKLEIEEFSLERLLVKVADLPGDKVEGKGLELLFDVAHNVLDALKGDALRLSQMLINYAGDALKLTLDQSGHLGAAVAAGVLQVAQQHATVMFAAPMVVKALKHPADVCLTLRLVTVG